GSLSGTTGWHTLIIGGFGTTYESARIFGSTFQKTGIA
ncbi:unnamed protein product, partial [marine sediment metagenome]